ncbi:hypothetical protein MD484_g5696, partial [Candolleomyces efflorescens]
MSSAIESNSPAARKLFFPQENGKKCGHCAKLSTERLKRCSGCAQISYCDSRCQRQDWKAHKSNCVKSDAIELGSFYPLIALIMELERHDPFRPSHYAFGHQIVNSPNPWDTDSIISLPDGSERRLIVLGDRMSFPLAQYAPTNWWPTAQSDLVRRKLQNRLQSEHFLLPSVISVLFAIMAEIYTTPTTAESVNRRGGAKATGVGGGVRLVYHGTPIADFGIAKGRVNVAPQDHFVYRFRNNGGVLLKGQDPDEHYWIYFTTVHGEDVFLDCGMFLYNHPMFVVVSPHYTKFIPSSLPKVTGSVSVPAYLPPKEAVKRGFLPGSYVERQRFSVLRDEGLKEVVRFSQNGFQPAAEAAITRFMERVAGHACSDTIEEALAIKWCEEACEIVRKNVESREYMNFPKPDEVCKAVSEPDPGDRERSALPPIPSGLDDRWMKHLKKLNKKHRAGTITSQQLREGLLAYKDKDETRQQAQK